MGFSENSSTIFLFLLNLIAPNLGGNLTAVTKTAQHAELKVLKDLFN